MTDEHIEKIRKGVRDFWKNNPKYKGGNFGKKIPDEVKLKMRLAKLGKKRPPRSDEWCKKLAQFGKDNANYGKNHSGENSPHWKGGKPKCVDCGKTINYYQKYCSDCRKNHYKSREYHRIRGTIAFKDWRESIFLTDEYTCQKCGQKGFELHPHHILNFSQYENERFNPNNGITFCIKCHRLFHKTYGQKNNNKEQIIEFIS